MALRDELERSGVWLFRWRGYLPLVMFIPVLAGLSDTTPAAPGSPDDVTWEAFCLVVGLVGLAIRVATVGRAPAGTSARSTVGGPKASALSTTGMYSVVRHPLYLGNYLQWLGVAMLPRNPWVAVTVSLVFWIYYERIMFAEEEYLRRSFGSEFDEWAARTPAFIPDFARWVPAALPFCWRTAVKRENSGMFALVAALAFVGLVQDAVLERRFFPDPFWVATFVLGALAYVALTLVGRRTNLLQVPGR